MFKDVYVIYFTFSVDQPKQRKAVFRELAENVVYVDHNAKPIKGVLQKRAFHMICPYISLKIMGLLHEVFCQSSKISQDKVFCVDDLFSFFSFLQGQLSSF